MSIKVTCDKCGKEIPDKAPVYHATAEAHRDGLTAPDHLFNDLCVACVNTMFSVYPQEAKRG